ncbi:MAG: hypothetical protein Q8Q86_01620 [Candidatus Daviesbacteria bacterium]|nr:hypothetical protein [Candidatus Daviesbacteria bacterium]
MKRTQLNLDEKTYYQLVSYAEENKTSLSSAARNLLSKQIRREESGKKGTNPFLELVKIGEKYETKGPKDLSINHDYYLYGEGSPKFGKHLK